MFIINHRRFFFALSTILVVASIVVAIMFGFHFGLDFTGGSQLEVSYPSGRPAISSVQANIAPLTLSDVQIQSAGTNEYLISTSALSETQHESLVNALSNNGATDVVEQSFDTIGPIIGAEAATKSLIAVALVIFLIVCYIAFAFRKVSKPISSWKYGLITVVSLVHNLILPIGVFAILGALGLAQIDTLFVTALLVILGFSVHDTIVTFDRVRENLAHKSNETFAELVGRSLSQTITRNINTSLTVVLTLLVLFFFGGASIHYFILALLVGIIAGTYSSLCLATPLLVTIEKWQKK